MTEVEKDSKVVRVTVNGVSHSFPPPVSLSQLLAFMDLHGRRGMAVAVNGTVVPAAHWTSYLLQDSDSVLIVHAVQGG
ncbi:MAG: sulfur carrier protein ThiS [Chitinophagales bacterium]|nr:sulfur carrier protein ThiS [Chitinophagales bacterium]MDW8393672.1 sulfur carrier protein ThiS [Chitinophagales bacterium]